MFGQTGGKNNDDDDDHKHLRANLTLARFYRWTFFALARCTVRFQHVCNAQAMAAQRPESALRKKLNSVCYHAVCETVVMDEIRTSHVGSEFNAADMCAKIVASKAKRDAALGLLLWKTLCVKSANQRVQMT